MLEGKARRRSPRSTAGNRSPGWTGTVGLAAAVGLAYFLAARLSVGLVLKPEGVAVFWPAAGISSGVLIALGPHARWPVAAGVAVATISTHVLIADPLWAGTFLGISNAAEALITAGLIERYFGTHFSMDGVRQVFGLLLAAIIGTTVSGIGGAVTYKFFNGPSAAMLITWQHWFASDAIGIVIVAPLVIGLAAATRRPAPRSEFLEGVAALIALAAMTAAVSSFPKALWESVVPVALLFPMLLWLAARCRPVFAAAAAFLVSIAVVSTAVFGVGHFGDSSVPFATRILQAQATILFVALGACILAALFAERRATETRLARANVLLERERDNKLMSAEAITASIAHEVRQPLVAIVTNAAAALRWLRRSPPDYDEVQAALNRITSEGHRTSEVFDSIRSLFRKSDQGSQQFDVNEIVLDVLQSLRGELNDHHVESRPELSQFPVLVEGHRGQLREVILNLVLNAIESMDTTTDRSRVLKIITQLREQSSTIAVTVEDSGSGIDPEKTESIFAAFLTTKSHGMGLGLAICRMIVERHGGQLTASSDGKSGARFQFVLPVAAIESAGVDTA